MARIAAAREYRITHVAFANVRTEETFRIPGLILTVRGIQGMMDERHIGATANLECETCGESVADCIELSPQLHGIPFEWSWESHVGQD